MKHLIPIMIILLLVSTSFVGVSYGIENKYSLYFTPNNIDMLIFISPQYGEDEEIIQAINKYIELVEDDINWSTEIIFIDSEDNFYTGIDDIMEDYYDDYSIKACIMVGEDINTPLASDMDYCEAPSTVPWYTTGGTSSYTMSEDGIIQGPQLMDICISLLYPTSDLDYQTKKSQIISVFNKFSMHRHVYYTKDILVFIDSEIAKHNNNKARHIYQGMDEYGDLYYKEDPTKNEVMNSLEESHSLYFVCGHSTPSGTCVNSNGSSAVIASYLDELDTPLFGASGCYVEGWWSDFPDNNRLDPSISIGEGSSHYGAMIFTAPRLRMLLLGFLMQSGFSYKSFIEHAISNLTTGKTLAESMIGHNYCGDCQTVVGDPTFHYSFENSPPEMPDITGSVSGGAGKKYEYTFTVDEPDKDAVYYYIDWGDDNTEDWIGLYDFGETAKISHVWEEEGNYTIKAKAKDSYGAEGNWSYFKVTMPHSYNNPFWWLDGLLDRFPLLHRLLEVLIT
jgi:hypothetical protein